MNLKNRTKTSLSDSTVMLSDYSSAWSFGRACIIFIHEATYVSEAVPVLDLATVLGNGGQPLLIFHGFPRFSGFFCRLHFSLHRNPQHRHSCGQNATKIGYFPHCLVLGGSLVDKQTFMKVFLLCEGDGC